MWLSEGYKKSPYFKESHYAVQKGERGFGRRMVWGESPGAD
jgi:hypothetical protein